MINHTLNEVFYNFHKNKHGGFRILVFQDF